MLFFIFVIISITTIILSAVDKRKSILSIDAEFFVDVINMFACVISVVMLIIIITVHTTSNVSTKKYERQHIMLTEQYNRNMYDNDNDVGKYELIKSITDWNVELAENKEMQRNLWLGIFVPNIYDDFKFIEL